MNNLNNLAVNPMYAPHKHTHAIWYRTQHMANTFLLSVLPIFYNYWVAYTTCKHLWCMENTSNESRAYYFELCHTAQGKRDAELQYVGLYLGLLSVRQQSTSVKEIAICLECFPFSSPYLSPAEGSYKTPFHHFQQWKNFWRQNYWHHWTRPHS